MYTGLPCLGLGTSRPPFAVSSVFVTGALGAWFEPSDFSNEFQDNLGATPVTASGQIIGKMNDKSGRGNHVTQATVGSRPTVTVDTGGNYYDAYNGTSSVLASVAGGGATTAFFLTQAINPTNRGTALTTPVNAAFATATTGGTLAAATYFYRVSAINAYGETLASAETSVVTTGTTSTTTVNWGAVANAAGYKVYGRTTGAELLMATLGNVLTFTDTGAVTPAGALPTVNTTSYMVIFSDAGANTGYKVLLDSNGNLRFMAGNGTAYTTVASTDQLPLGATSLITVYDDGTNLKAQVNTSTVFSVARPVVVAGTAAFTLGSDNGAATGFFNGRLYAEVYGKNTYFAGNQVQLQGYVKSKSGLGGIIYPTPTNNQIIVVGDSRLANNTQNANVPQTDRVTADGLVAYMQMTSKHRGRFVGNYAVNGDTIDAVTTRLTAAVTRGQITTLDPGLTAGIVVFLAGVNNTNEAIGTVGPKYNSLIQSLVNNGKVVIVCNELPSNLYDTRLQPQLDRRTYLDSVVIGTNNGALVRINSFDLLRAGGTTNSSISGLYRTDTDLHPNALGNRKLGEYIGVFLEGMLSQAGYPARNTPPTPAASVFPNAALTGVGGTLSVGLNKDGQGGTCFTGPIADGYTVTLSGSLDTALNVNAQNTGNQLKVLMSKGTDSDGNVTQVFNVVGSNIGVADTGFYSIDFTQSIYVTAANFASGNQAAGMNGVPCADGDVMRTLCRMQVSADAKGLLGPEVQMLCTSATYPMQMRAFLSGSVSITVSKMDGSLALDCIPMSQPAVIPTGYSSTVETKTLINGVSICLAPGTPINFTVTFSRLGVIKAT